MPLPRLPRRACAAPHCATGKDGASIVKHFAWFSKSGTPNHYDLSLLDAAKGDGSLSPLGSAYVDECKKWNAAAP